MAPHSHEQPSISLVVMGAMRERSGHSAEVIWPLSVSLMPAGVVHDDEFGPDGARLLTMHLDATDAERGDEAIEMSRWRWSHCGPGARELLQLLRALRQDEPRTVLERLALDAMVASTTPPPQATHRRPPTWLARVRAAIDDDTTPPSVMELACIGEVHRVYLARKFRQYFGCTMSEYIRRRRVQRAAHLISGTPASLTSIAHAAGFSDQPHLCHTFQNELGVTPSHFRNIACCA